MSSVYDQYARVRAADDSRDPSPWHVDPTNPGPVIFNIAHSKASQDAFNDKLAGLELVRTPGQTKNNTVVRTLANEPKKGGGGGGGYNWGSQIAALKAGGEQNLPLIMQQYNDLLGDQISMNEAAHEIGDQATDQARDLYAKQRASNNAIGDDKWYLWTQKNQNMKMAHDNSINNQYGSIWNSYNDLLNLNDDQFDQENTTAIKLSNFQNATDLTSNLTKIDTDLAEQDLSTYQQIKDILRQGGAALANYANQILDGLAGYNDFTYRDRNGNITASGWDYLKKFGIVNDGNGGFTMDYNIFSPWGNGWGDNMTMDEYLDKFKSSRPEYRTIDYAPMIRQAEDTRRYVQTQPYRNMQEAYKNGKMSAVDYTNINDIRYGA